MQVLIVFNLTNCLHTAKNKFLLFVVGYCEKCDECNNY